jgi:hypothetical protein
VSYVLQDVLHVKIQVKNVLVALLIVNKKVNPVFAMTDYMMIRQCVSNVHQIALPAKIQPTIV